VGEPQPAALLPYGDHAFDAFGPAHDRPGRDGRAAADGAVRADGRCRREVLAPEGYGPDVRSLLTAGVDTTVHGPSTVLHAPATHPDQWARLGTEANGSGPLSDVWVSSARQGRRRAVRRRAPRDRRRAAGRATGERR
jgi:hypothetical protein